MFEITLSGTPAGSDLSWTVEHVYDRSLNEEFQVPGMDSIVASTEDAAFARACDHIDKWLTTGLKQSANSVARLVSPSRDLSEGHHEND